MSASHLRPRRTISPHPSPRYADPGPHLQPSCTENTSKMGWNQVNSHRQHSPRHLHWFRVVVTNLCSVTGDLCSLFCKQIPSQQTNSFCVGSYKLSSTLYYDHLSNVLSPHYPVIHPVLSQQNNPAVVNASLSHQFISISQHHPGLASILPGWPSESHRRGTQLPLATAGVSLTNNTGKKKFTLWECKLARNVTNGHLLFLLFCIMRFPLKSRGWFSEYLYGIALDHKSNLGIFILTTRKFWGLLAMFKHSA